MKNFTLTALFAITALANEMPPSERMLDGHGADQRTFQDLLNAIDEVRHQFSELKDTAAEQLGSDVIDWDSLEVPNVTSLSDLTE